MWATKRKIQCLKQIVYNCIKCKVTGMNLTTKSKGFLNKIMKPWNAKVLQKNHKKFGKTD